jgi:hypothetical protein
MFSSCHPVELVASLLPSSDVSRGKLRCVLRFATRPTQLFNA